MCKGWEGFLTFFFLEIFVSDAAEQTFLGVAVILFELDECLTVAGMGGLQTTFFPQPDDVVVFRFKLLQQVTGTFGEPFLAFVLAVSIEEGNHGIDNQQVDGASLRVFGRAGEGSPKT